MSENDWLAQVKEGDTVAMMDGWHGHRLAKVTKTTATQIHCGLTKYSRKNGKLVGSDRWSRNWLVQPTPQVIADIREKMDREAFAALKVNQLPIDAVRAMLAIARAAQTTGPALREG